MGITYSDSGLDGDLSAIGDLSGTGLITRTASNTAAVRTITGGTGVTVTNGDGVSGNPTISLDTDLSTIAGLTPTDNGVIIGDGAAFTVESGATLRTSLGLAIGTDVQAYSANLTSWAAVTPGSYLTTAAAAAAYQPLDADLTSWAGVTRATGFDTFVATPTSANLAALVTDETGTGSLVLATSPTLVTPNLGTPSAATLTNATGLPISTGVSGLGTGVATALAVNVGTAGAPVVNGGALGTPSSGTLTNATGLPVSGITSSTTTALGLGSIELGHASDTTISRASAGRIAVEGSNVLMASDIGVTVQAYDADVGSWASVTRASGFDTFVTTPTSANFAALVTDETGTGSVVFSASPALTGTPTAPTAAGGTNTTQIATTAFVTSAISTASGSYQPLDADLTSWASVTRASGFDTFATTPSSANLAALVTGETGSGALVFGTSPTITTDLTITGATVTTSAPALNATQTWNAGAVAFTGLKFNVTDTASAAGSLLIDLQVGGVSKFSVTKAGAATFASTITSNGSAVLTAASIGSTVQAYDADLTTWAGVTPGTGVATALAVNVGTAGAFVVNGGALGTPSSGTLTNATGLPISSGVSGLGTGVATALAVNVGTAGAPVVNGGALGTPSSGTLTNATGLPISTGVSGLGAGVATFLATPSSANLISAVTDETGSGALVFGTTPTLATPVINGLPTGTGVASAATASTLASRDSSANTFANNHVNSYATTATAAGTTVLTAASAAIQYFTGTTTQTVTLPVASTLTTGFTFTVVNNSTGTVTVQSSGANTVLAVAGGTVAVFTCILASGTTAASWSGYVVSDSDTTSWGAVVRAAGFDTFVATPSSANLASLVTDETGSGALVFGTSPTLVTPALGTPSSVTLTNATGLPVSSGISGLGTGVVTALAVNVGTAGAFVANGGALGTPSSGTLTNATGLPVSGITSSTTTALGLGSIELGHASDTTIARVSAGRISVEGSNVLMASDIGSSVQAYDADLTTWAGVTPAAGVTTFLATPSSANLKSAVTDETGSGALVFGTSPTITTDLTISGGTVTASAPVINATQTWNSGAVTFTGLQFNATDTASASGSLLVDLQVGGVSKFSVTKAGAATFASTITSNGSAVLTAASIGSTVQAYDADLTTWAGVTPGTGVTTALAIAVGSSGAFVTNGGALGTPSSGTLTNCTSLPVSGITSSTTQALGVGSIELGHASDTTISRVSAGVIAVEGSNVLLASNIGSTVQAYDADLATIAGLTATTDNFIQAKSSAWASRTPTQVTADLIAMVGDSGSGGTKGLVPAPAAGDAAAGKYLKADGTWTAISGGGDMLKADNLAGLTNLVTARSNLGVAIGTDVQAYDADLASWAGVTRAAGFDTFAATPSSANLASLVTGETGSGALVFATSPTLVTPALGTPSSVTLTNATGLPVSTGISGLGTGVATFLATPSSANLASAVTDETGSGALVFGTSPTIASPTLSGTVSGTPTWASGQTFPAVGASSTVSFVGVSLYTSEPGSGGPIEQFFHESASPAAGDECGGMSFYGRDSANNTTRFALFSVQSNTVTDASEAGEYIFYTQYAGVEDIRLRIKGGLYHGNATGGDKGNGTINFTALYDDNTLLTCYIRDMMPGQEMAAPDLLAKWDAMVPNLDIPAVTEKQVTYEKTPEGDTVVDPKTNEPVVASVNIVEIEPAREEVRIHEPLRKFLEKVGTEYDPRFLESYHQHFVDKHHLTAMPNPAKYDVKMGMPTGALIQRLVETVELQHLHSMELLGRIKALEAIVGNA